MGDHEWKDYAGKWQVEKSENFEDYLKIMGAPFLIRKVAANAKAGVEIAIEGDKITFTPLMSWMKQEPNTFKVNGPAILSKFSKRLANAKVTWKDGKLVTEIDPSEDGELKYSQKITREMISKDEYIQTMEVGDVKCIRHYKRVI